MGNKTEIYPLDELLDDVQSEVFAALGVFLAGAILGSLITLLAVAVVGAGLVAFPGLLS